MSLHILWFTHSFIQVSHIYQSLYGYGPAGWNWVKANFETEHIAPILLLQVNLCQKLLLLHQLTHNMTTDCSLNYKSNTWKFQAQTWEMSETISVHNMFSSSSAKRRASDKDLPVHDLNFNKQWFHNTLPERYLQLPLWRWGAGNFYLLVLSSWKVNIAENPIAVMGSQIHQWNIVSQLSM